MGITEMLMQTLGREKISSHTWRRNMYKKVKVTQILNILQLDVYPSIALKVCSIKEIRTQERLSPLHGNIRRGIQGSRSCSQIPEPRAFMVI